MILEQVGVRLVVLVAGLGVLWWQLRWLLRAYRRERDRQVPELRSSRPFLLSIALMVFVALATVAGIYTARRIAVGAIIVSSVIDAARRRLAGG
jgi:hypothetical protein